MALSPGTHLGPYEIVALLGAGGMGEVYRARDPRLGRDVALKVLPDLFSKDAERMARFAREAQILASLNHPNIAILHGLEDSGKTRALVMELVEGPTLAERMATGPVSLDEALPIARQIAEALEAAHDRGIIHRDLKPANVKITREDLVKVLDFGLAKALDDDPVISATADSPTISLAATRAGALLGTAAYMAPEQAKGKPVDRRADIWAFGVVLFEMLAGRQLYAAATAPETLAAVMKDEPRWDLLPADIPTSILNLLHRCLDKDPKHRLQAIGEARITLEQPRTSDPRPPTPAAASRPLLWMAVAVVFCAATLLLAVAHFRRPAPAEPTAKLALLPPEKATFGLIAVSPDGRRLAFIATQSGKTQLWVRPLDSLTAQALPGTDDANYPFWSPDGRFIGFFAQGKVKKVDASGGPPQTLADAPSARGGAWSRDGVILFTPGGRGGLNRVPASGGESQPVTIFEPSRQEVSHRWPVFLPDGHHFLCYVHSSLRDYRGIYISSLDSKEKRRLLGDESNVAYVEMPSGPGYLLFVREGLLLAHPFDVKQLQLVGEPFPVAERVGYDANFYRGAFSASHTGVLVYDPIGPSMSDQLTWFDRQGQRLGVVGAPVGVHYQPWLSPDEKSVAVEQFDLQTSSYDIWLVELSRGIPSRFTFDPGHDYFPVWSPDGSRIAFASTRNGIQNVYLKVATGAGKEELLQKSAHPQIPEDWSRDGQWLAYRGANAETNIDLWVLPLSGDRKPVPFLRTKANEFAGRFSPDGKWMAYHSDESGRLEVYVQPFPASGGKWLISKDGGSYPKWRRDGKEMFYLAADRKIMAVEVQAGATFQASVPRPLFETRISQPYAHFAVTGDGRRFLVPTPTGETQASTPATVVLNWTAGIKR